MSYRGKVNSSPGGLEGVGWAWSWGVGRLEGGNGMFSSCGKTPMKLLVRVTELARPYWGQGHLQWTGG